jgi:Fe2+ or Zn2+ uptake regulation protein
MALPEHNPSPTSLAVLPARKGRRQTEQRRAVFDVLMAKADHPTAVEVFMRVKGRLPSISLATVYNCLDTLVECGVVRMVHRDREPSRFCANLTDHAHFFCTHCGSVTDLPLRKPFDAGSLWDLPEGVSVLQQDTTFRGLCGACMATGEGVVAAETGGMVGEGKEEGGAADAAV